MHNNNLKFHQKIVEKEVKKEFIALINSCVEGYTGEWDTSGEGKNGFQDMIECLQTLANHYNVDISDAKEI